jgi:hypothetical protein
MNEQWINGKQQGESPVDVVTLVLERTPAAADFSSTMG